MRDLFATPPVGAEFPYADAALCVSLASPLNGAMYNKLAMGVLALAG